MGLRGSSGFVVVLRFAQNIEAVQQDLRGDHCIGQGAVRGVRCECRIAIEIEIHAQRLVFIVGRGALSARYRASAVDAVWGEN